MKKKKYIVLAIVILVLLAFTFGSHGDGAYGIEWKFIVVDESDNPIEGATVTTIDENIEIYESFKLRHMGQTNSEEL